MRGHMIPGLCLLAAALLCMTAAADDELGFKPILDGKTLAGWQGGGYVVEDGVLVCPAEGGGMLYTEKAYDNFVYRFEFKLTQGANNGIAIRAPGEGDPAYVAMEIQVLDDPDPMYAGLQPWQVHGSIYGVVPAKRGALKPVGEWNSEEILADGRHIKVTLNDTVIVDANLDDVTDPDVVKNHPGLARTSGKIGFCGHGSRVEFRNMRVREILPDNVPPEGFTALFDGTDLTGWKGLVESPPARAAMTPEQLAEKQKAADDRMRQHWSAVDGVLTFDGKGDSLCTAKDYKDFELLVDWRILEGGDSGIYLRGTPQVQIWQNPVGSGGLFNNAKNPKDPLVVADSPVGEWNHFRIAMIGEKVTVFLNSKLVVDNVTMENYWEPGKPIYPTGQIELQNHGNSLYFRNIYIREIGPDEAAKGLPTQ